MANVQRFLSAEFGKQLEAITDTSHEQVNATVSGQTNRRLDEDLVLSERVIDAIITSVFSGQKTFCNSLLGPRLNYEPPRITWTDGEDIDFDIWDEIKDTTARFSNPIATAEGDMSFSIRRVATSVRKSVGSSRINNGRRPLLTRH